MRRRLAACIALIASSIVGSFGCMSLEWTDPPEITPTPVPSGVVVTGDAVAPPSASVVGSTALAPVYLPSGSVSAPTDSGCPVSPDAGASDAAPPSDDATPADEAGPPPPAPADDADVPADPDAPSDDAAEPDPPPPVGGQAVCPSYDPNCVGLLPPDPGATAP